MAARFISTMCLGTAAMKYHADTLPEIMHLPYFVSRYGPDGLWAAAF